MYEALKARSLKLLIVVICETSFDIMHITFSYETDPSSIVIRNEVEKMHGRLCWIMFQYISPVGQYAWQYILQRAGPFFQVNSPHAGSLKKSRSRYLHDRAAIVVPAWLWENGERMRKLKGNWEEMEREWGNGEGFTLYISSFSLYFLPFYPFPITKIVSFCLKILNTEPLSRMSQKTYAQWENN